VFSLRPLRLGGRVGGGSYRRGAEYAEHKKADSYSAVSASLRFASSL